MSGRGRGRIGWLACSLCWALISAAQAEQKKPVTLETFLKQLAYVPIPLEVVDHTHLAVRGLVNGKKISFLVDTGCTLTSLDPKVVAVAGLRQVDPSKTDLEDDFLKHFVLTNLVIMDSLVLEGIKFRNQPARPERLRFDYANVIDKGILGSDFFMRNYCILDCRHGCLYIRSERLPAESVLRLAESLHKSGFADVSSKLWNGDVCCPGELNGKEVTLIVDTGSPWTILDWDCAKTYNLKTFLKPVHLMMSGIGSIGAHELQEAQISTLDLGGVKFANLYVGLEDLSAWGRGARGKVKEVQGLLGMETLASAYAIIDYGSGKVWLGRSPGSQ